MDFKLYGRARRKRRDGLLALSEVSFACGPEELRRVAQFLEKSAGDLEKHGADFGHAHLQFEKDLRPWDKMASDVIVANPNIGKPNKEPNQPIETTRGK